MIIFVKNTTMEKTAIEWFSDEISKIIGNIPLSQEQEEKLINTLEQAKEIEKQQLEQFYNHGKWAIIEHGHGESFEDYYNQTFKQD